MLNLYRDKHFMNLFFPRTCMSFLTLSIQLFFYMFGAAKFIFLSLISKLFKYFFKKSFIINI